MALVMISVCLLCEFCKSVEECEAVDELLTSFMFGGTILLKYYSGLKRIFAKTGEPKIDGK